MKKVVILFSLLFLFPMGQLHAFCFEEAGFIYNVSPRLLWAIAVKCQDIVYPEVS